jgi:predicted transposase/invertase (TIGR01784 family)
MSKKGKKGSKVGEGLGIFINPRSDFGFKRVLNNPKLLTSLLMAFGIGEKLVHPVALEKYLLVEQFGETWVEHRIISDIRAKLITGEQILVEMQNFEPKNFIERLWYYSTFLVRCQSPDKRQKKEENKKKWNYDLKAIFVFAIVNFPMIKSKAAKNTVINWIKLKHDETNEIYSNKLNFIIIDLTKFNKTEEELETDTDFWLYTFKYAEMLTECPEKMKNHEIFSELYDILRTNKLTPEEMKTYQEHVLTEDNVSLFTDRAEERGLERGFKEATVKFVLKAAAKGNPIEEIADITDLTVKQVHAILRSREKIEA